MSRQPIAPWNSPSQAVHLFAAMCSALVLTYSESVQAQCNRTAVPGDAGYCQEIRIEDGNAPNAPQIKVDSSKLDDYTRALREKEAQEKRGDESRMRAMRAQFNEIAEQNQLDTRNTLCDFKSNPFEIYEGDLADCLEWAKGMRSTPPLSDAQKQTARKKAAQADNDREILTKANKGDQEAKFFLFGRCRDKESVLYGHKACEDNLRVGAAEAGSVNAQYSLAMDHLKYGNVEEALVWLNRAADSGDSHSLRQLRDMYFWGRYVARDFSAASNYIRRLDENEGITGFRYDDSPFGNSNRSLMAIVNVMGFAPDDFPFSIEQSKNRLLFESKKAWGREAQFHLGIWYLHGNYGFKKSEGKARNFLEKSGSAGLALLSHAYAAGTHVKQSAKTGEKYYQQATRWAGAEDIDTWYYAGMYVQSIGGNTNNGKEYFHKAAKFGHREAAVELAKLEGTLAPAWAIPVIQP